MKTIGIFCDNIPEEIIYSFGFKTEKILASSQETMLGNLYLSNNICSYAKNTLDYVVEHQENFEGFVLTNCCHAMETLYESLKMIIQNKFIYLLDIPREHDKQAVEYFRKSLEDFINELSKYSKKTISAEQLEKSYLEKIESDESILKKISLRKIEKQSGIRVLISGSKVSPASLHECISQLGGEVIIYDIVDGIRAISNSDDIAGDIIYRIAYRYLNRPTSTRSVNFKERIHNIAQYIKQYKIDLVILDVIKFCSNEIFASSAIAAALKKEDIPYIIINTEYVEDVSGQILTRIEAKFETLE